MEAALMVRVRRYRLHQLGRRYEACCSRFIRAFLPRGGLLIVVWWSSVIRGLGVTALLCFCSRVLTWCTSHALDDQCRGD